MSYKFGKLAINKSELCLANVLQAGQSFRWIWDEKLNQYSTTMKIGQQEKYSVVILRQDEENVGGNRTLVYSNSNLLTYPPPLFELI